MGVPQHPNKRGRPAKSSLQNTQGIFHPQSNDLWPHQCPSHFHQNYESHPPCLMDKYSKELFVYMDNVLIATEEDVLRHRKIVHTFLEICKKESYFLKASKCIFKQSKISYLGIVIDGSQIKINLKKVKGIKDWPREIKTHKGARSVLGTLSYQHPFILFLTHHARPITDTIKTTKDPF